MQPLINNLFYHIYNKITRETGFEPATPGVTSQCYRPTKLLPLRTKRLVNLHGLSGNSPLFNITKYLNKTYDLCASASKVSAQ